MSYLIIVSFKIALIDTSDPEAMYDVDAEQDKASAQAEANRFCQVAVNQVENNEKLRKRIFGLLEEGLAYGYFD